MPAGEALAPRGGPLHEALGLGRLPQGEVGGIALVGLDLDPGAGPRGLHPLPGQAPVRREGADVVVDRAVHLVGQALGQQGLDHGDHVRDVVGGPGHDVGQADVDQGLIGQPGIGIELGDLGRRLPLLERRQHHPVLAGIGLVVAHVADIGDVLDVEHLVSEVVERPAQEVAEQVRPQVADMGVSVDRAAAGVDRHPAGGDRLEGLDLAGQRVVQADRGHGVISGRWPCWSAALPGTPRRGSCPARRRRPSPGSD